MDARCRLKCAPETCSLFHPQFLFDPVNGVFPPPAPTLANPFTGFVLPGAGAGGINIIDNDLQNPMVHQMNVGVQHEFERSVCACAPTTCTTSARISSSAASSARCL